MVDRLEVRKIEPDKKLPFKGLDGKEYPDQSALEQASRNWFRQNNRYISAVTGKEYTDYDHLLREEEKYWRSQIIPQGDII